MLEKNFVDDKLYFQSHNIKFDLFSYRELYQRMNIAQPIDFRYKT